MVHSSLHGIILGILAIASLVIPKSATSQSTCPNSINEWCNCTATVGIISITCKFDPTVPVAPIINITDKESSLNLLALDLSANQLTTLPDNILDPFSAIDLIKLNDNNFTDIPAAVLNHGNVSKIDLSHNNFKMFNFTVVSPDVQSLDLSFNEIDTLLPTGGSGFSIQLLNLSNNALTSLAEEVWTMASYLDLSNNLLTDLPPIPVSKILYLDLSGNKLTSVPNQTFSMLHSLQELNLSHNTITHLDQLSLEGLGEVRNLNFSGNYIHMLPPGIFKPVTSLLHLDLSANRLTALDMDSFTGPTLLLSMSLSDNQITEIAPATFTTLPNLRQLDFSSNQALINITDVEYPQHIVMLTLRNCNLHQVDECKYTGFLDLQDLDLSNNPLECSCKLKWLNSWFQDRQTWSGSSYWSDRSAPWTCLDKNGTIEALLKTALSGAECPGEPCLNKVLSPVSSGNISVNLTLAVAESSITAQWEINDTSVYGFRLQFDIEGDDNSFESPTLDRTERKYIINDITLDKSFKVCLQILANATMSIKTVCTDHEIISLEIVIGILAGTVFLIPAAAALLWIIHKDRQMTQKNYEALMDYSLGEEEKYVHASTDSSVLSNGQNPMVSIMSQESETSNVPPNCIHIPCTHHKEKYSHTSTKMVKVNKAFEDDNTPVHNRTTATIQGDNTEQSQHISTQGEETRL